MKSDTFPTASGNRTGNWWGRFGVASTGVCTMRSLYDSNAPSSISWFGDVLPLNSVWSGGLVPVTTDASASGTAAGGGDYHLTGAANPAYSRVAAGLAMLPFDLTGLARRNDGTGAAGPYERTV
jgi:hypothetical protein